MKLPGLGVGLMAVAAALGIAQTASAQLTTCAVEGSYAIVATLFSPNPTEVAGTFVFSPPKELTNAQGLHGLSRRAETNQRRRVTDHTRGAPTGRA